MASMVAVKKELRGQIKKILSEVSDAATASQTSNAAKTLLSLPEYKAAKRISIYLSMPAGEISTTPIVKDALARGKKVFIPYTYEPSVQREGQPKSIMDMVELQSLKDFESLEPDKWNIPTPSKDSLASRANSFGGKGLTDGENVETNDENGLDLIVMPGMAFDSSFGRLGHGKGFYDYFLRRSQASSRMPFRGENYWYFLLPPSESVPMDTSDFRLDALVTGAGELRRAKV
ncbi:5-formyltetrahydrofolate cyclo-ligase [Byssothecium circinans]|uniref:5-formyltetrahydrofolate cyclo-ligase n=1 Tax=Byssothecium circinans TaxID=147558 RepID=A0A6A5TCK2_9PLEO|nr:5-formyltetrahydrofolate cyclo-ligase [Byssothecium circinans]KAF1948598.1 5-formyltetrahydrofolate cyclo-ligase [Byssothecium circinans]